MNRSSWQVVGPRSKASCVGQYSIRINDQFRLCFSWLNSGPEDIEIVDYH